MIRAVADRTFLPTKNVLDQIGNMMILTGKTLTSAVRPPYPYGSEFVGQFLFAMKLCWFPLLVSRRTGPTRATAGRVGVRAA